MILTAALVGAAVSVTVLILAAAVGVAAATAAGAVLAGLRVTEPHIGHAVFGHIHAVVGVGDLIVDGVLAFLRIVGSGGQGTGVGAAAIADLRPHTRLGQIGDGEGMGLVVYHAVIVGHNALGGDVLILLVVTEGTVVHHGKAAVGRLGQNVRFQIVPLQTGGGLIVGAVAETAVFAALGGHGVILAVGVLIGHSLRQVLHELGGTVIQPVDIFQIAVVAFAHIGIQRTAVFTDCFRPMIAGIIGIHTRSTIQNGPKRFPIGTHAVGILDIPCHGCLAVAGVFGSAEHLKGCGFAALAAVESLTGHDGIGVQFVGAVVGSQPMLCGIMVSVLLGGKGRGHQGKQHDHREQRGQQALMAAAQMIRFFFQFS